VYQCDSYGAIAAARGNPTLGAAIIDTVSDRVRRWRPSAWLSRWPHPL
jgi:hypothetical protein